MFETASFTNLEGVLFFYVELILVCFFEYVGELRIFVLRRRKRSKYKRNHSPPLGPERGVGVTSLLGLLQAK